MADAAKTKKITRRQLITIGGLSLTLLGTIAFQSGGNDMASAKAGTKIASAAESKAASSPMARMAKINWPQVSFEEMLRHNPFADPTALPLVKTEVPAEVAVTAPVTEPATSPDPEQEAEQLADQSRQKTNAMLATLKNEKVKLILRTNRTVSAMIGDRLFHEGDIIDGVRIVSIQPNGVLVEPADVISEEEPQN